MSRYALLIDAGYLWATAGETIAGTSERAYLEADPESLIRELIASSKEFADDRELLRVYWYDGAVNRVPSVEQQRIAELDDVKLRLGRMVGGRQKGVDALLLLDLVRLAANKAADVFFLFAGDEDLSEAVREAQASGARVLLMTVAGKEQDTLAKTMRAEADGLLLVDPGRLEPYLRCREGAVIPRAAVSTPPIPASLSDWSMREPVNYVDTGHRFGRAWRDRTGVPEWARVLQGRPRIPSDLDAELLREASDGVDLLESERVSLREGFWAAMDESDITEDGSSSV